MARMLDSGLGAHRPRTYNRSSAQASGNAKVDTGTKTGQSGPQADVQLPSKVTDILDWVGEDVARAETALDAEMAKPEKDRRKTLVSTLEDLIMAS